MHYVTNGNIYAPVMMLAERASDMILGNSQLPRNACPSTASRRAKRVRAIGSRTANVTTMPGVSTDEPSIPAGAVWVLADTATDDCLERLGNTRRLAMSLAVPVVALVFSE